MKTLAILCLLVLFSGCISQKQTDSFAETLLDEDRLVRTLAQEVDKRKTEFIDEVGEELQELGEKVVADLKEKVNEVTREAITQVSKEVVTPALVRQERILTHAIELAMARQRDIVEEYSIKLNEKHAEILGRLPLYGFFIVLLVWGASIIDDVFRYLTGRKVKRGEK